MVEERRRPKHHPAEPNFYEKVNKLPRAPDDADRADRVMMVNRLLAATREDLDSVFRFRSTDSWDTKGLVITEAINEVTDHIFDILFSFDKKQIIRKVPPLLDKKEALEAFEDKMIIWTTIKMLK